MEQTDAHKIKLLLIDDDEDDYLIVRSLLSKIPRSPFQLEWERDFDAAATAIDRNQHEIYLIDYRMGAHSGLELLEGRDLQQRAEPFIILTGAGDEQIEQKAMQLGAADYLVKGTFDTELLSRVLRYSLQRKHMEAQRIQHLIEVNRTKDEFISLASHQLRTPASSVKQYIGMILQGYVGEITDMQRTMLTTAYENNERQLKIVNDLLHVAQADAGKVKLQKTTVNITKLTKSILEAHNDTFILRKQKAVLALPPKSHQPVIAELDELHMRMALENIIDNASKYSGEDTAITVSIRPSKNTVAISIQDQGVGIDPKDFGKLFQKFSRIYNPLSSSVGGTGLGLYWTQHIISLHGGTITVESKENEGATFTITLPLHSAEPEERP